MTVKPADQATILQLKALGFSDERVDLPRRLVGSVYGKAKTGKTHFCLDAPDPILFFNIDLGTEGVIEKFQDGFNGGSPKQIYKYDVRVPKDASKDVYETMWADFKARITTAYKLSHGTLVVDTATEAYELCRLAHFGKLTQILPHHYAVVNNDWREFMRLAYDSTLSTLFIHKVKPKYINNARTNEYEISGMSEIPYLVQINIETTRQDDPDGGDPEFSIKVVDSRHSPHLNGDVYTGNPMATFGFLLNLIHGE